jgi:hypothetical protein
MKPGLHNLDYLEAGAKFDESGKYRYSLWRTWSLYQPHIVYVLLNPSTADEHRNDPTLRRCIEFARAWQFGSVEVVNLFAYRAPNANELLKIYDPVGVENNYYLTQAIEQCSTVVVGWGTNGTLFGRDRQVLSMLSVMKEVYCLGATRDGHPRHPLYVKGETTLVPFIAQI